MLLIDDLQETNSDDFNEVLDMSKSQFMEYWRIKFFSGRALIPKKIKNSNSDLDFVRKQKWYLREYWKEIGH